MDFDASALGWHLPIPLARRLGRFIHNFGESVVTILTFERLNPGQHFVEYNAERIHVGSFRVNLAGRHWISSLGCHILSRTYPIPTAAIRIIAKCFGDSEIGDL